MITTPKERIEDYTARGWWGTTMVHEMLWNNTAAHPEQLAVADQPNREELTDGAPHRLTYAELNAASFNLACDLLDQGVGNGDALIVQLPNITELVVSYFACSMIGAIISPVPVQYGPHELRLASKTISPVVMLSISRIKGSPLAHAARDALPEKVAVLAFGEPDHTRITRLELDTVQRPDNEDRIRQHIAESEIDANTTLTICWTSGTTGTPKGVPRTHNMWLATGRASAEAGQYKAGDRVLNPFPLVNMAALGGFFFPFNLYGCSLILHHPFDPPVFLQQLETERITFTIAPPAVLNQMARTPELWNQFDFSALRCIGSGSAPLAPWMIETFGKSYGKEIVNFYGSNEGIALFSTPETSPEPEVRASMFPRMGVPGMPWKGVAHETVRTRVVNTDTGEEITEPGVHGELMISGATVFDGYLGVPNDEVFSRNGWFHTGDLVEICGDPPNYYRIVGRCKDIINRGGMKISPAEIDILIEGFPGLAEGAVCSYPDETMGERVCACVVANPGSESPSLEQINEYLLEKGLAKFKLPEKIQIFESLPRNPLGKVQRNELEERVKNHG